jgi:hypothetical protein
MPEWTPASAPNRDPLLAERVVTLSDHLADAVPDDDTWFADPETAQRTWQRSPRRLNLAAARRWSSCRTVLPWAERGPEADRCVARTVLCQEVPEKSTP